MPTVKAYAAQNSKAPLAPFSLERRDPREHDVVIGIKYCGICHSDIHQAHSDWGDGVVDENFVLRMPKELPLDAAAPLLCAGITLYSPLKHWKAGPGKKVAIIGLGGLGHIGVKLAHALGAARVQKSDVRYRFVIDIATL